MGQREMGFFGEAHVEDTNERIKDEDEEKGKEDKENERLREVDLFKPFIPHPLLPPPLSLEQSHGFRR